MHMCKEGEGKGGSKFVRMVNAAPYPMMVICFDHTLDDLDGFVLAPRSSAFLVLILHLTWANLMYSNLLRRWYIQAFDAQDFWRSSWKATSNARPHVYHFFTSTLVGQRRELASLQAFGTDGEQALESALSATFINAQHVRCFLHFRGNLERNLQELGLPRPVSNEIIKDIMGYASQLQYGLVDAQSTEQLDEMLAKLKGRWSELERPYNSPPFFHKWFLKHCPDNVARYMLRDARERAGQSDLDHHLHRTTLMKWSRRTKC